MSQSVVVFTDTWGLPQILRTLPREMLCGVVAASIRPHQHSQMQENLRGTGLSLMVQPKMSSAAYSSFLKQIGELRPDWILINSYSMLLPEEVLSIPRNGALNIHGALLPRYRGANPTQWAIIRGERETGVTLHRAVATCDAGEIFAQRSVPIDFEDTWVHVNSKLERVTEQILCEDLPLVLRHALKPCVQNEAEALVMRRRTPQDGQIDWELPVIEIYNLIRALVSPLPGAFYLNGGERVVVDRYRTVAEVAWMKFEGPGKRGEGSGRMRVVRPTPDENGNRGLVFELIGKRRRGEIAELDWEASSCVVRADRRLTAPVMNELESFARNELGMHTVLVANDDP
jgi:methionyl-tRNA formyltransferase